MKHRDRPSKSTHQRGRVRGLFLLLTFSIVCAVLFSIFVASPWRATPSSAVAEALGHFRNFANLTTSATQTPRPAYHVLFSSGCSEQQHWESYVFFYHAFKVNQPGNVTRLVSGCTQDEERHLRQFHEEKVRTMSERFHVFFTPDFGSVAKFGADYKYNNKPNSVYLWMRDTLGPTNDADDGIIFLLDPDMILLRPLLHDFTGQEMIYASAAKSGAFRPYNKSTRVVQHGMPMAQQDGYLGNEWMNFNVSYITQGRKFQKLAPLDGNLFWNAGPPYLSTVRDMWKMVTLWKDYVPRIYEEYPELFAEMYGLIVAAVTLDLPHTLVKSIVVSWTDTSDREGWAFVDNLSDDEVCDVTAWSGIPKMPLILHYCKRYLLGKFFFSKYRLKKKFISCDAPLLTMPPRNAHKIYDYWIRPPPDKGATHDAETKNLTASESKREAFMLCGLIYSVNEAAKYYKSHHCNGSGNFSEVYNFHDDPHSW